MFSGNVLAELADTRVFEVSTRSVRNIQKCSHRIQLTSKYHKRKLKDNFHIRQSCVLWISTCCISQGKAELIEQLLGLLHRQGVEGDFVEGRSVRCFQPSAVRLCRRKDATRGSWHRY